PVRAGRDGRRFLRIPRRGTAGGARYVDRTVVWFANFERTSPMGLFDKLRERLAPSTPARGHAAQGSAPQSYGAGEVAPRPGGAAAKDPDEAAVERYRYMLRTAPPET